MPSINSVKALFLIDFINCSWRFSVSFSFFVFFFLASLAWVLAESSMTRRSLADYTYCVFIFLAISSSIALFDRITLALFYSYFSSISKIDSSTLISFSYDFSSIPHNLSSFYKNLSNVTSVSWYYESSHFDITLSSSVAKGRWDFSYSLIVYIVFYVFLLCWLVGDFLSFFDLLLNIGYFELFVEQEVF